MIPNEDVDIGLEVPTPEDLMPFLYRLLKSANMLQTELLLIMGAKKTTLNQCTLYSYTILENGDEQREEAA